MTRLAHLSASFQNLGRSLMLPIAVLPIAGLLLRLGQSDIADPVAALIPFVHLSFLATAGNAIFDNLGLLFAIGVAIGFARENHGAAGLAGVVGFLVATEGAAALVQVPSGAVAHLPADIAALASAQFRHKAIHDLSVPIGIITGIAAGYCYNRFHAIKLPEYLAFFGGRRFVPILMGLFGVVLALLLGVGYETLHEATIRLSQAVAAGGSLGLFLYGVLNRLLIVTGLHHILNNVVWFILGDYHGATGDLRRFFAGDPTAGSFMAGFFPVMMFGLPAACLAMYHTARPERRKEVGGMLMSQGLTSFLTGVTEPVEFSFIFLAPALYGLHMILTGLAFVILKLLDVKLGFSFSAGLFDYVINFSLATHPWRLLPVGLGFAALYYGVFRWAILRFDLATPGREQAADMEDGAEALAGQGGQAWLDALGGSGNISEFGACTTRLRLVLVEPSLVDEGALRRLGARGMIRPSPGSLQVIIGPDADRLSGEIRAAMGKAPKPVSTSAPHPGPDSVSPAQSVDAAALRLALGDIGNISSVRGVGTRLVVTLNDIARCDQPALAKAGVLAWSRREGDRLHLIISGEAGPLAEILRNP